MQYEVRLTVVQPSGNAALDLVLPELPVVELSLAALGYQALIGRDVLTGCRFLFDGPAGRFELGY